MSERSRPEESDDHFSPEKAKTLTLRDTRGELYCLQAYLLAAERFCKDIFAAIPPVNNNATDIDLNSGSLKCLLRQLREMYEPPSCRRDHLAQLCAYFKPLDVPDFYAWCKNFSSAP